MAVLSTAYPTIIDFAKAENPDGSIADVAEILAATNPVLTDMGWMEGNLPTGHLSTMRTGLPIPTWRKLYQGVLPTKGTTAQVTDTTGNLEAYGVVDKSLADLSNNAQAFRLLQDTSHIEGMSQELAQTLFFGNEGTEPEAFTGLAPRFNDLAAENADNIVVGGGVGADNASIWLVVWDPSTVFGIVPKGSTAGLSVEDLGRVTIDAPDGSGGQMEAYRSYYKWSAGITMPDWRYVVRIPNIDKSLLTPDAVGGADLPDLMFQAIDKLPDAAKGRPAFYMNRTIRTFLRRQLSNKVSGSTLEVKDVGGVMTSTFQEVPLRRTDALQGDETLVV